MQISHTMTRKLQIKVSVCLSKAQNIVIVTIAEPNVCHNKLLFSLDGLSERDSIQHMHHS